MCSRHFYWDTRYSINVFQCSCWYHSIDLRYLAVILAVIIGGPIASTITIGMILVTRLLFMDYSLASQVAFIQSLR